MILVETGATSATCGWEIPSKLSIDKVPWAQEEQWECTDDFFASDGFSFSNEATSSAELASG